MQLKGNVLITGATGSLGSAILDRAHKEEWNAYFTALARNETKMAQLIQKYPRVRGEIGDVRDVSWLNTIFPGHDVVVHAAAIKQIPTAESNVREAMLTNVIGSQNVAMACVESGVKRVIGISTDKACAPTTVYGCTKYLMEGLFREANSWSNRTGFMLVRYGNVLRSNASVLPLFEKQIAEDKPFTVTCEDMTRFFLTMDQAIDLILDASNWEESGVTLVPKPPAMSLKELTTALDPNREVISIGVRPGEKMHEQLINSSESLHTLDNGKYFVIHHPAKSIHGNLGDGFEYSSQNPHHKIIKEELYAMLDSYNPLGGRQWSRQ